MRAGLKLGCAGAPLLNQQHQQGPPAAAAPAPPSLPSTGPPLLTLALPLAYPPTHSPACKCATHLPACVCRAKTPLANFVTGLVVMLTLLVLTPIFKHMSSNVQVGGRMGAQGAQGRGWQGGSAADVGTTRGHSSAGSSFCRPCKHSRCPLKPLPSSCLAVLLIALRGAIIIIIIISPTFCPSVH